VNSMTLKTGKLAYYESFHLGFFKCKVTSITGHSGTPSSAQVVTFAMTTNRSPFKRGETMDTFGFHVVPRRALRKHGFHNVVRAYTVQVD
jgi:hypothetical protein